MDDDDDTVDGQPRSNPHSFDERSMIDEFMGKKGTSKNSRYDTKVESIVDTLAKQKLKEDEDKFVDADE